jgi:hypothetical protein
MDPPSQKPSAAPPEHRPTAATEGWRRCASELRCVRLAQGGPCSRSSAFPPSSASGSGVSRAGGSQSHPGRGGARRSPRRLRASQGGLRERRVEEALELLDEGARIEPTRARWPFNAPSRCASAGGMTRPSRRSAEGASPRAGVPHRGDRSALAELEERRAVPRQSDLCSRCSPPPSGWCLRRLLPLHPKRAAFRMAQRLGALGGKMVTLERRLATCEDERGAGVPGDGPACMPEGTQAAQPAPARGRATARRQLVPCVSRAAREPRSHQARRLRRASEICSADRPDGMLVLRPALGSSVLARRVPAATGDTVEQGRGVP